MDGHMIIRVNELWAIEREFSMKNNNLINKTWSLSVAALLAYAVMLAPEAAFAGGPSSIESALCEVISWFIGPVGKSIATLAIIIIGVGALMGKVSWGMAIIVGLGVAVIFGAPEIAGLLGATGGGCKG
jgi:type IV secretory pathway VirB2 component (pilin)